MIGKPLQEGGFSKGGRNENAPTFPRPDSKPIGQGGIKMKTSNERIGENYVVTAPHICLCCVHISGDEQVEGLHCGLMKTLKKSYIEYTGFCDQFEMSQFYQDIEDGKDDAQAL